MKAFRRFKAGFRAVAVTASVGLGLAPGVAGTALAHSPKGHSTAQIEHVVVIFQENVSFDHYFGTYPRAG